MHKLEPELKGSRLLCVVLFCPQSLADVTMRLTPMAALTRIHPNRPAFVLFAERKTPWRMRGNVNHAPSMLCQGVNVAKPPPTIQRETPVTWRGHHWSPELQSIDTAPSPMADSSGPTKDLEIAWQHIDLFGGEVPRKLVKF